MIRQGGAEAKTFVREGGIRSAKYDFQPYVYTFAELFSFWNSLMRKLYVQNRKLGRIGKHDSGNLEKMNSIGLGN